MRVANVEFKVLILHSLYVQYTFEWDYRWSWSSRYKSGLWL